MFLHCRLDSCKVIWHGSKCWLYQMKSLVLDLSIKKLWVIKSTSVCVLACVPSELMVTTRSINLTLCTDIYVFFHMSPHVLICRCVCVHIDHGSTGDMGGCPSVFTDSWLQPSLTLKISTLQLAVALTLWYFRVFPSLNTCVFYYTTYVTLMTDLLAVRKSPQIFFLV